jgi:hypothetical protein
VGVSESSAIHSVDWPSFKVICDECYQPARYLWHGRLDSRVTVVGFSCHAGPVVCIPQAQNITFDSDRRVLLLANLDPQPRDELVKFLDYLLRPPDKVLDVIARIGSVVSGVDLGPRDAALWSAARVGDDSVEALESASVRLAEMYRDGVR